MHKSPGRHQRSSRSTATVSSLISSHSSQLGDAVAQEGRDPDDVVPEAGEPALADRVEPALADHKGALPVIAAVEHHQHPAVIDPAGGLARIARAFREPHPQHVDRRAEIGDREPGALAHDRMPPVRADHEIGAHLDRAFRRLPAHPDDPAGFLDEVGDLGFHPQVKARQPAARFGEEIEEIPLRHQRDELAAGRQMGEIGDPDLAVADDAAQLAHFLMRARQKGLEEAQLVHDLQGRGVDRVAAEVAQEIAVLFQDQDGDPGARQQSKPSMIPAGPPPAMQQVTCCGWSVIVKSACVSRLPIGGAIAGMKTNRVRIINHRLTDPRAECVMSLPIIRPVGCGAP